MPPDEPINPTAEAPAGGGAEAEPSAAPVIADPGASVASEPSADAPSADGGVTPHTNTPTLLETGVEPETAAETPTETQAEKPAEPEPEKPAEEPKPEETPAEPAPEAPIVYDLVIPDGITAAPEALAAYTEVLREHRLPPETGQRLLDMHTAALQTYAADALDAQHRTFAETRKGWRDEVMADEQLGGAGFRTVMTGAAQMRDMFVPEADRPAFNEFLRVTGAGDHPAFLRLLHNASKFFGEPKPPPADAKPAPNQGGPKGRMGDLYTHPTSRPREG